jgi:hypothetical protein
MRWMAWISKLLLAAGFVTGIYGVTEPNPDAVRWALGLVVTGMLTSLYGLARRVVSTWQSGD